MLDRNQSMSRPVVGVIVLDAEHSEETLDLADPFGWRPGPGVGPGFLCHPDAWPVPALFAVAWGATVTAAARVTPAAVAGVRDAIARLDGRCDLIVGGCGNFVGVWPQLGTRPRTPVVLSAMDYLDVAAAMTRRDIGVLSFWHEPAERLLATRPDAARFRVQAITPNGDWPLVGRPDWATNPQWTEAGLESGLRAALAESTAPGGKLHEVGAVVLECTILPQFRHVVREYVQVPVFDVRDLALELLR